MSTDDDSSSDDETVLGKRHKTIDPEEFKQRQAHLRANPISQTINKANIAVNKATLSGRSLYNFITKRKSGGRRRRRRRSSQSIKLRKTGKSRSRGKRRRRGGGGATRKINSRHFRSV